MKHIFFFLAFFNCLLGVTSLQAAETKFINPVFRHMLFPPNFRIVHSLRLKTDSIEYPAGYDPNFNCQTIKQDASSLSYSCIPAKIYSEDDKIKLKQTINFYSTGKDKNGYCQVYMSRKSEFNKATHAITYSSQTTDCGEIITPPPLKHTWLSIPPPNLNQKINPAFNYLTAYSRTTFSKRLFSDGIQDDNYAEKADCLLIQNDPTQIAYECDIPNVGLTRRPYKDWMKYNIKKYDEDRCMVVETYYYDPELNRSGSKNWYTIDPKFCKNIEE